MRSTLYTIAKLLGDLRALQTGRIGNRIFNRALGKLLGRLFK